MQEGALEPIRLRIPVICRGLDGHYAETSLPSQLPSPPPQPGPIPDITVVSV